MSRFRKFIVACVGLVGTLVTLGFVPASDTKYVSLAIAILTAAGVYVVPNTQPNVVNTIQR